MLQPSSEKPKPGCLALQDDDESKPQKRGGLGGLFGGRSKASADAPTGPQKQKKVDSKLVDAKPAGKEVCYSSAAHQCQSVCATEHSWDDCIFLRDMV